MNLPSYADFESLARSEGFDEVLQRHWAPGQELDTHRHPFAVKALVAKGDFWLICQDSSRHLHAGDSFELPRDEPHAERYGPEGCEIWVARRNTA